MKTTSEGYFTTFLDTLYIFLLGNMGISLPAQLIYLPAEPVAWQLGHTPGKCGFELLAYEPKSLASCMTIFAATCYVEGRY